MSNFNWKPPPEWKEIFSENLDYLKSLKGFDQSDLAKEFELNRSTISNWERKASLPNLELLIKVCTYFGTSIDELLFVRLKEQRGRASPEQTESPPGTEQKEGMEERIRRLESMMFQKGISAI
jgi:transcriptional regulator with XRE-family HTH domain